MKKQSIIKLTTSAMLIAIYFVLDRFAAINLMTNQYKLSFIAVIFAAVFLGPAYAAAVGGLGDLISALIMPTGPYFPGFTVVAALVGLMFGLFLYKKITYPRIIISVFIAQVAGTLILNTFNVAFYMVINNIGQALAYPKDLGYFLTIKSIFISLLATRLLQAGIYFVAEIAFLILIKKLKPNIEKALKLNQIV